MDSLQVSSAPADFRHESIEDPGARMQASQPETSPASPGRDFFFPRWLIGAIQGVALYLLANAEHDHRGIATHPALFVPLLLIALLIPPTLIVGLPRMRGTRLVVWAFVFAAVLGIIGYHDVWRMVSQDAAGVPTLNRAATALPSSTVSFFSGSIVFVAYCLILAGESARSWRAPYASYFETSWKLGLQVALSGVFTGLLFVVLWLGASLFQLLRLDFLDRLLRESWFVIPVVAMAFASALHITDVRPDIIRGSRTLVLSLLSWLLLVLVAIVGGFLVSMPFTGLESLWATHSAAWILLGVVAAEIVFMNAVFKSGLEADPPPRVLRACLRISCLLLPVLVALAAYALALRIGQYGLTPQRVMACAATFVACLYAIGYTWAALVGRNTFARIASVNVVTAWVTLAVLVAIFTPLADPARLSVNSQVERLLTGKVDPAKFDYEFLAHRSDRYGLLALMQLRAEQTAPNAGTIRELSKQVANKSVFAPVNAIAHPDAAMLAANIVSRTPGQSIPASFLSKNWRQVPEHWTLPVCLTIAGAKCDAYFVDLMGNHTLDIVLFLTQGMGFVFDQAGNGDWEMVGTFSAAPHCAQVRDALAKGSFQLATPTRKDILVNGQRIQVEDMSERGVACSKE